MSELLWCVNDTCCTICTAEVLPAVLEDPSATGTEAEEYGLAPIQETDEVGQ